MDKTVEARPEELYASVIADLLAGVRNVAVGMLSPVPGAGALLAAHLSGGQTRLTILGSRAHSRFTNGGAELFDRAGRGAIDAFFLSGGQIDGHGNINLVGTGEYPQTEVRWSGSFGSAYLYYLAWIFHAVGRNDDGIPHGMPVGHGVQAQPMSGECRSQTVPKKWMWGPSSSAVLADASWRADSMAAA